jgi:thioredoxin reductase (NADPH)
MKRTKPRRISCSFALVEAQEPTGFLPGILQLDASGYILTGPDLRIDDKAHWKLKRPPFFLETNLSGLFAAGDVRHNSIKRCATAVGEGAMAVSMVHQYLATRS